MYRGRVAIQIRREQAEELKSLRDKRSDKQQLSKLISGGHGNCKEAKRLRNSIEKDNK